MSVTPLGKDGPMSHAEFVVDAQGRLVEVSSDGLFDLPEAPPQPNFEITFDDGRRAVVEGADAYQPEGQLITFFATRSGRGEIDPWAKRMASYRASTVVAVERIVDHEAPQPGQPEQRHLVAV